MQNKIPCLDICTGQAHFKQYFTILNTSWKYHQTESQNILPNLLHHKMAKRHLTRRYLGEQTEYNWNFFPQYSICKCTCNIHYSDVIMSAMTSQITGVRIVCSTVCTGADQRKHQSSASLAFVTNRSPVNSPNKWPATCKMFPFDDVIMSNILSRYIWVRACPGYSSVTAFSVMEMKPVRKIFDIISNCFPMIAIYL